jgi:hypothetical protein
VVHRGVYGASSRGRTVACASRGQPHKWANRGPWANRDKEWGIIIVNEVMWFIGEYMGIPGVNYTWFEDISMTDEVRYSMLAAVSPRLANFMNGITY